MARNITENKKMENQIKYTNKIKKVYGCVTYIYIYIYIYTYYTHIYIYILYIYIYISLCICICLLISLSIYLSIHSSMLQTVLCT